jgi:hypothetical protein
MSNDSKTEIKQGETKKKLIIKKETVRELTNSELENAAGGMMANSMMNGCTYKSAAYAC